MQALLHEKKKQLLPTRVAQIVHSLFGPFENAASGDIVRGEWRRTEEDEKVDKKEQSDSDCGRNGGRGLGWWFPGVR